MAIRKSRQFVVPDTHRDVLASREKRNAMTVLVRNDRVFHTFREVLKAEHFGELDQIYAVVWRALCQCWEQSLTFPGQAVLTGEVDRLLANSTEGSFAPEDAQAISKFLKQAYNDKDRDGDPLTSPGNVQWATIKLRQYMQESVAAKLQKEVRTEGKVLASLDILQDYVRQYADLSTLGEHGAVQLFDDGWDNRKILPLTGTGTDYFDAFMGGQAAGEVYGLMGPFGSCKTTMVMEMAGKMAKTCYARKRLGTDGPERTGYAVYVTCEATVDEMRIRFIASLGQIQRARLEIMDGLESLSTDETLEAYELERFKSLVAKGRPIPGEQKRAQRAVKLLKQHLIVLDMTGINKENKNDTAGKGYVTDLSLINI